MKHINLLREMQYERLRMTRRFREMQRIASLPGIDLSPTMHILASLAGLGETIQSAIIKSEKGVHK